MRYTRRSGNSYRLAVSTDGYGSYWKRWAKRQAAKRVRRYKGDIPDGSAYKRLYNSWDICDFAFDHAHDDYVEFWFKKHFRFSGKNYFSK